MDEAGILGRIASGDGAVLDEIDRAYRGLVINALRKTFRIRHEDAEDIFLQALFEFWQSRKDYDPEKGTVRAVLFRRASWRARDRLRESRREPHCVHGDTKFWSGLVAKSEEEPLGEDNPVLQAVGEALESLKAEYQTILRMDAAANGVARSAEISRVTEIPKEQVPVYRQRAREMLRAAVVRTIYPENVK